MVPILFFFCDIWVWVILGVEEAPLVSLDVVMLSVTKPMDGVVDVVEALHSGAPSVPRVVHHVQGAAYQEGSFGIAAFALCVPGVFHCQRPWINRETVSPRPAAYHQRRLSLFVVHV